MLALLLVPPSPTLAFWILTPCFMLDAVLNAGILIANNGFMIKNSPTENRTMYIAATTAIAGMVGGITSILAGWMMQSLAGHQWTVLGWTIENFQIMFLISIVLRWVAFVMTRYVHEPHARHTWDVMKEIVTEMRDRFDRRSNEVLPLPKSAINPIITSQADLSEHHTIEREVAVTSPPHRRVPAPKRPRRRRERESQHS